jgi:hypothetical protein
MYICIKSDAGASRERERGSGARREISISSRPQQQKTHDIIMLADHSAAPES